MFDPTYDPRDAAERGRAERSFNRLTFAFVLAALSLFLAAVCSVLLAVAAVFFSDTYE